MGCTWRAHTQANQDDPDPSLNPQNRAYRSGPGSSPVHLSFSTYQARVMEKTINLHKQKYTCPRHWVLCSIPALNQLECNITRQRVLENKQAVTLSGIHFESYCKFIQNMSQFRDLEKNKIKWLPHSPNCGLQAFQIPSAWLETEHKVRTLFYSCFLFIFSCCWTYWWDWSWE